MHRCAGDRVPDGGRMHLGPSLSVGENRECIRLIVSLDGMLIRWLHGQKHRVAGSKNTYSLRFRRTVFHADPGVAQTRRESVIGTLGVIAYCVLACHLT